jgi:hypothetical protein
MRDSNGKYVNDSLGRYYASNRAAAFMNKSIKDREIGKVFAEYKDNLVVIAGENKKEHDI